MGKNGNGKRKYFAARGNNKKFKGSITSAVYQTCSRGVLISHDRGKENHCRNDAFRLFNYFADKWYGEEKTNEDAEEEIKMKEEEEEFVNIEASLAAEVEASRNSNKSVTRRFTSQKSGCNNIVFIQFNGLPDSPSVFIQKLLQAVAANKDDSNMPEGRGLLRLHPVDMACKAQLEEIEKSVREFVPQQLSALAGDNMDGDVTKEYHVTYKCRNNGNLGMHLVTEAIVGALRETSPGWKWNCRSSNVMVLIDIICATCSISVVKDYGGLKRFNLRELRTSHINKAGGEKEEKTECNVQVEADKPEENVQTENDKSEENAQVDAQKTAEECVESGGQKTGPEAVPVEQKDEPKESDDKIAAKPNEEGSEEQISSF